MDTQGAVKAFLTHAKARGLSHNTVQAYRWALNHITCDNLPDEPEAIESILAHAAPRLAQESLHDLWRVLRTFFRWARLRFEMPDPTAQVTPPPPLRSRLLPKALSSAQVCGLLDQGCRSSRDRLLVLVPLDTGLRLAEIAALRKDDLAGATIRVTGKGRKSREVPISSGLITELLLIVDGEYVWKSKTGTLLTKRSIGTAFRRIFDRARVSGGAHSLRHTFATKYLRRGGDLYRLSRILGHSTTRVTERYLHLVTDDLLEEHRRLSPALPYLAAGWTLHSHTHLGDTLPGPARGPGPHGSRRRADRASGQRE